MDTNLHLLSEDAAETSTLLGENSRRYTMEDHPARVKIDRPVCFQDIHSLGNKERNNCPSFGGFSCHCSIKKHLRKTIPSIEWLSTYKWKEWLIKDAIAGFTVAIMNIPQGMAYALLGNVPPVVGIYMAFFPVIVYAFLGTSRHVSMGSFAVVCLMAGNVVATYSTAGNHGSTHNETNATDAYSLTPVEVATSVTFFVGVFQLIMYVLRFGALCTLLSETLVSGFTAGAALHVFTSQIKDIFGIKIKQCYGPFKLIRIYGEIFSKIHTCNIASAVVSAITIVVLIANNEFLKPLVQRKTQVPIPIELIIVVGGTLASYYGGIAETYSLTIVGHIPVGLPEPKLAVLSLLPEIALQSLLIAIIAYAISLSMAFIFANKLKYEVDPNQELLAQGCGNIVGSFFSCLPFSASLSRSVIQQSVGGCTQMTSLVSASILVCVLLWIAPVFETLPRCVLASLIVVALKGILFQVKDIVKISKVSKSDSLIFISTYLAVIIIEIDYGLMCGVLVSLLMLILRGIKTKMYLLERLRNTEIYVKAEKNEKTESIPGIMIIHYEGSINFINKAQFKKRLTAMIESCDNYSLNQVKPQTDIEETIILDLRSLIYVDSSGANVIKEILTDFMRKNILLVGLQDSVVEILRASNTLETINRPTFLTVHDAVAYQLYRTEQSIYSVRL